MPIPLVVASGVGSSASLHLPEPGQLGIADAGRRASRTDEDLAVDEPLSKYTPEELPTGMPSYTAEDFELLQVLGRGGYGKVLLAKLKSTEDQFALKAMKKIEIFEVRRFFYYIRLARSNYLSSFSKMAWTIFWPSARCLRRAAGTPSSPSCLPPSRRRSA